MAEKKIIVVPDMVPMMSKITEHKLNSLNYLDWSQTIELYLLSISMDRHLTDDPPTDESKLPWMRDDARLFLQLRNSIDSEVVGLITHCRTVKELMNYLEFLYSGKGNISLSMMYVKHFTGQTKVIDLSPITLWISREHMKNSTCYFLSALM